MLLDVKGFQMPENMYYEEETASDTYCKLIAEPLERGYGVTIGNALRRTLLSSIEGTAIIHMKVNDVYHEFSTIKGVKEDVVEIVLNLKKIKLDLQSDDSITAYIDVTDKDTVIAGDIKADGRLRILNPESHIARLDHGAQFKAELKISRGRGYVPAEELKDPTLPIGTITIDAIFTPIEKVVFTVDKTRVGKSTDYDKLILEVWTDGSLTPKEAIGRATQILLKHFKYFQPSEEEIEDDNYTEEDEDSEESLNYEEPQRNEIYEPVQINSREFNKNLVKTVDELEFSVRSQNCLKNADIKYIYELVQKSEHDMLKMKNFGRKSLDEIREMLLSMGLDFNVKIDMEAVKRELAAKNGG